MSRGGEGLLLELGVLLVELVTLLLLVSSALALAARRVGLARLQRWLGGSPAAGTWKGMAFGFVIPFCTYSAIPAFVGLAEARVRTATLAGFLLAAPLLDPLVAAVLVLLFGWQATLAYLVVTAATVFSLALAADALRAERLLRPAARRAEASIGTARPVAEEDGCQPDPFTDEQPWRGVRSEAPAAARYAVALVRGLAVPMVFALAVAAAIIGLVPEQLLGRLAGSHNPAPADQLHACRGRRRHGRWLPRPLAVVTKPTRGAWPWS